MPAKRIPKLTFIIVGAVAAVVLAIVIWVRGNSAGHFADVSDTPAIQKANPAPIRSATTTRPTHAKGVPAKRGSSSAQQHNETPTQQPGEAQILVATGYRRMQQHDFDAARDAFEEALSIDPGNSAAREGLRAAKAAETMEGVAGVLGR